MILVSARTIEAGDIFRKKNGSFDYRRISDSSARFYKLDYENCIYGVAGNGNMTEVRKIADVFLIKKAGMTDKVKPPTQFWVNGRFINNQYRVEEINNLFSRVFSFENKELLTFETPQREGLTYQLAQIAVCSFEEGYQQGIQAGREKVAGDIVDILRQSPYFQNQNK